MTPSEMRSQARELERKAVLTARTSWADALKLMSRAAGLYDGATLAELRSPDRRAA